MKEYFFFFFSFPITIRSVHTFFNGDKKQWLPPVKLKLVYLAFSGLSIFSSMRNQS